MRAAGANASHWHAVNAAALELAEGAGRSSAGWKEESEELAEAVLLARVQGACHREYVSF